ncbi:putative phage tail protein [Bosea sp. 62]|uniref:baseplate multidomain protein megatron n=1 Tax=unclassified Bosea (in: a-proteobacteria) TaxID=2653178 RepID=UPI00125625B7|nr:MULTISPECIES: glycoside hydrolase/phage tail family protein [unclassified Bosea (in: a-proteobacteria)]CAD5289724.1 putative phage tail protein [Bosea sp. 7B]CAD5300244.1 putative phage tail protein [Bosea sp. 21B]CAD5300736.1 putative phage tail protein [Bosea sp. 46]VVT61946.1 putative phage tail protein [Bosea sp. EC-HK365B]VXB47328.1 putative phage tail protein [Bosea sp. 125]
MATLVLQVAGSVLGAAVGGPFGAMIGRSLGAIAGASLDQSLFGGGGGTRIVEGPRLKEIDGLASTEGAPIPRVYGRARLGGQLIWATRFEEEVTTTVTRTKAGGKGGQKAQKTYETTYSYYANLAVAVCEGPIAFVRRIWANGREVDFNTLGLRVHRGFENQEPDPLIAAKEAGAAPAYRGTAYVVFERFPLADYGNRVPQFSFEVVRAVPGLGQMIRAVTLIPGASEFIYQPTLVNQEPEAGVTIAENRHQLHSATDIDGAIGHLLALCPNLRRISLVVSWFGDDLRAGSCTIAPRVEIADKNTPDAPWSVAGLDRASARVVSQSSGLPAYGGTPSDESVVALIRRLRHVYGLEVVLYPFVMMDVPYANSLPDPHTGNASQPPYPWRGRITCSPAPGQAGSPDGTPIATGQIVSFLGTATAADFSLDGDKVICARTGEWSFRRAVLHAAMLAKAAGGVEGFIIGSELVGLTRVRGAPGYYPMVAGLTALAAEVRAILPPPVKLTYAADWTEYGAHVRDGGLEVRFPLDPLWASAHIDAIGIDYYAPLSDWRDTPDHADLSIARGPADVDYLRHRLTAGEGYDWYYSTLSSRYAQTRLPITDGAFGKPWVFRPKDLPNWWLNPHVERFAGFEIGATGWLPGSKPIWLTEVGLPAVDKGGNSPNVFPDPKSIDGGYPHFSTKARDDLVQARGIEAILSGFDPALPGFDPQRNPTWLSLGPRMVDPANIFVWTWDARPFPAFPDLTSVWADGGNYETGHWINGRLEGVTLDRLVRAILADYGLPAPYELAVDGFADGYVLDRPISARQALEPLTQAFGFDAVISSGKLAFRGRAATIARALSADDLVLDRNGQPFELRRAQESELPRELRLVHIDGNNDYRQATARSRRLAGAARRENAVELPMVTRRAEGQRLADQRLQEIWAGRETLELDLSPRCIDLEAGDVVSMEVVGQPRLFRLTRISDGPTRRADARSVEPAIYRGAASGVAETRPPKVTPRIAGRPDALILDLPVVRDTPPPLQSLAAFADPWPGGLAIWRATEGMPFALAGIVAAPSIMGETLSALRPGPLWRTDRHAFVDVRLRGGGLASVAAEEALAGANALAFIDPAGEVEIATAARVELIAARTFRLSQLVRGLGGSETAAARTLAAGARVVVLDGAAVALTTSLDDVGRHLRYRIGPPSADVASASMRELSATVGTAPLRPLAPVRPRAKRLPFGVALSWVRRSRVGGDSWEAVEVPLGEEVERYRVTLRAGAEVIRVIDVGAPTVVYEAAQELADFGSAQAVLDVELVQLSIVAGVGFSRRGHITVR